MSLFTMWQQNMSTEERGSTVVLYICFLQFMGKVCIVCVGEFQTLNYCVLFFLAFFLPYFLSDAPTSWPNISIGIVQ